MAALRELRVSQHSVTSAPAGADILARLDGVKRSGGGHTARCPAHGDKRNSLKIGQGDDGRVLLHCFAGCSFTSILDALGITGADLCGTGVPVRPMARASKPNKRTFPDVVTEILAAARREDGQVAGEHPYFNANGTGAFNIYRIDRSDGSKAFRQYHRVALGQWISGFPDGLRPLYCLPGLMAADPATTIYIVEGEKTADAARALGLVATTSVGGSSAASKTNWDPLAGRTVAILPDNDGPGQRYAEEVAGLLAMLSPPPSFKIVDLPGLPAGGDLVEFIEARHG